VHFVLDLWSTRAICYRISGDYKTLGMGIVIYTCLLGSVEGAENCVVSKPAALLINFHQLFTSFTGHAFELVIYTPVIIFSHATNSDKSRIISSHAHSTSHIGLNASGHTFLSPTRHTFSTPRYQVVSYIHRLFARAGGSDWGMDGVRRVAKGDHVVMTVIPAWMLCTFRGRGFCSELFLVFRF
jgi:hypothetical protein